MTFDVTLQSLTLVTYKIWTFKRDVCNTFSQIRKYMDLVFQTKANSSYSNKTCFFNKSKITPRFPEI